MGPIDEVEQYGARESVDAQVLKGIAVEDMIAFVTAQRDLMRQGTNHFFNQACKSGHNVHIISSNWSFTVLKSTLMQVASMAQIIHRSAKDVPLSNYTNNDSRCIISVHTNELEVDEQGITTGRFKNAKIITCNQKLQCMINIISKEANDRKSIYIGGSIHDLRCLVHATIGIVLIDEGKKDVSVTLSIICAKLKIQLVELSEMRDIAKQKLFEGWNFTEQQNSLFIAYSWSEISRFIREVTDSDPQQNDIINI